MNNQHNISSPVHQSDWDAEIDASRPLSSSIELCASHLWTRSSEQVFPESTDAKQPKKTFLSRFQRNEATKGCWGCSTWPRTFAFIFGLGLVIAASIVIPIVLLNTLGVPNSINNTTTTSTTSTTTTITTTTTSDTSTTTTSTVTTTSTTSTTTSVCGVGCAKTSLSSSSRLAYYTFDSNLNDITGVYLASGISSPTYTEGYVGSAISLDAPSSQRLITSSMNLYNKSFTIELWFYFTRIATQDNAFFGQQSLSNIGKQCLFLMSRFGKLYMGFYDDDTTGSTILQRNTWYHAAFVYDNDQRQRFIYLNGLLDGQSATGVGPYLGTSGLMTIGGADVDGTIGTPYFSGYIDELSVFTRAKTACEIINDASLAAYFPLDGSYTDFGPNSLTLSSSGTSFISGYTNQGVYLSGSNSYIQINGGLTGLGRSNYSYSIAFWIYPVVKGVLVHVSANSSGIGWCTPFINFDSSGYIITQVYDRSNSIKLNGPFLLTNVWTHITQTYSPTNGQRLYINGALYASSSASTIYSASEQPNFLTFGNMLMGTGICNNPSTVVNLFQGRLDELRIYSREISSIGACLLAQS